MNRSLILQKNDVARGLSEPAIQTQVRTAMRKAPSHRVDLSMPDHLARLLDELDRVTAESEELDKKS